MRVAVAGVLLAVIGVAIFVSVRWSHYPVSVVLQDVSPAEMVDGAGKGMWQVTVVMTNYELLQFEPNSIRIETKSKSSWTTADGHLSGFWSGRTTGLIFVVPPGATDYRIRSPISAKCSSGVYGISWGNVAGLLLSNVPREFPPAYGLGVHGARLISLQFGYTRWWCLPCPTRLIQSRFEYPLAGKQYCWRLKVETGPRRIALTPPLD